MCRKFHCTENSLREGTGNNLPQSSTPEFYNILHGDLSWMAVRSPLHEKKLGAMTSPS